MVVAGRGPVVSRGRRGHLRTRGSAEKNDKKKQEVGGAQAWKTKTQPVFSFIFLVPTRAPIEAPIWRHEHHREGMSTITIRSRDGVLMPGGGGNNSPIVVRKSPWSFNNPPTPTPQPCETCTQSEKHCTLIQTDQRRTDTAEEPLGHQNALMLQMLPEHRPTPRCVFSFLYFWEIKKRWRGWAETFFSNHRRSCFENGLHYFPSTFRCTTVTGAEEQADTLVLLSAPLRSAAWCSFHSICSGFIFYF